MSFSGIQLRSLSFHGPNAKAASVNFEPGLNIIYGASNTGKSFIIETIDFMLGGKGPLTDIPQSNEYDQVLLSLVSHEGSEFTIKRNIAGGPFNVFEGLYSDSLPEGDGRELAERHKDADENNLSALLLSLVGLRERRVRKNAKDETQSLSFRNLARLCIVNEEEIIQRRSPLSDGNYTADTANTSVFKLLLTGVDDSALVSKSKTSPEAQRKDAQIELLTKLITDGQKKIADISGSKKELDDQKDRLVNAMEAREEQLAFSEENFKALIRRRRTILKKLEADKNRQTEVLILLERFKLLRSHYSSDLDRLNGIREAGSLFVELEVAECPVCGASPESHAPEAVCQGDIDLTIQAAEVEISKIEARELELANTISDLKREEVSFEKRVPAQESELHKLSSEIQGVVAPDLRRLRASYKELADKGAGVKEALGLFDSVNELIGMKAVLEQNNETPTLIEGTHYRLTASMVDPFAKLVESILKDWNFPDGERVHFDLETKDLVISGKPRTSFGKGLRAITQAAFTIALQEYCINSDKAHPGFVVLDSPLLSYKEPDSEEDDLRGTDLNSQFFDYLEKSDVRGQVVIVENTDPPESMQDRKQTLKFTGRVDDGRFGLFPVE